MINMPADSRAQVEEGLPWTFRSAGMNHTGHFTEVRYERTHLKKSRGAHPDFS